MKPVVLLPPVLALLAVTSWIGAERHSISSLETERATLRKAIAGREAEISAEGAGETPDEAEKAGKADEPINWKAVAAMVMETRNGDPGDMRESMRLQRRLLDMTGAQLAAALDEIATLDLPADARASLEGMLMGPLISKDPEMALNRFIDRFSDENSSVLWQFPGAIQQWALKDPAAADAWMDRAIAAGKFDSKSLDGESRSRVSFESSLVSSLLATDPAAAGKRVAALVRRPTQRHSQPGFQRKCGHPRGLRDFGPRTGAAGARGGDYWKSSWQAGGRGRLLPGGQIF